jgi:hypothetical protein
MCPFAIGVATECSRKILGNAKSAKTTQKPQKTNEKIRN